MKNQFEEEQALDYQIWWIILLFDVHHKLINLFDIWSINPKKIVL